MKKKLAATEVKAAARRRKKALDEAKAKSKEVHGCVICCEEHLLRLLF